jgi:hypothetical protein
MCIISYQSFINDKKIIDSFEKDILKIVLFNRYENKFNYLHGLWLIPTGIFFIFFLILLEIPSFDDIYKHFKKAYLIKFKK